MILIIILCSFLAFTQCNAGDDQFTPPRDNNREQGDDPRTSPINLKRKRTTASRAPRHTGRMHSRRSLLPAMDAEYARYEAEKRAQEEADRISQEVERREQALAYGRILNQRSLTGVSTCGQEHRLWCRKK